MTETEKNILELEDTRRPFTLEDIVDKLIAPENSDVFLGFGEMTILKLKDLNQNENARVYEHTLNFFKEF